MATVESLVKRTNYLVDDAMDIDIIITLFNEAIEEIDTIYGSAKHQTTTLNAGELLVNLPNDLLELIRIVEIVDGKEREVNAISLNSEANYHEIGYPHEYINYTRFGDEIRIFPTPTKSTDIQIDYYGANEKIPDIQTDPSLKYVPKFPERYHRALTFYAASKYFENWEDNPEIRMNYKKQFDKVRDDMAYDFDRKLRKAKSKTVYIKRGWY